MKTIIKYELVINEALRSALNYHTPDEQINEFIRDNVLTDRQENYIFLCNKNEQGVLCLRFSGGGRPVSDAVKGVTP